MWSKEEDPELSSGEIIVIIIVHYIIPNSTSKGGILQANFELVGAVSEAALALLGMISGGVRQPPDLEGMLRIMTGELGITTLAYSLY